MDNSLTYAWKFFHLFKPKAIPTLPTCGRCITVNPHISNSFLPSQGTFLANDTLNHCQRLPAVRAGVLEVLQMSPSHPVSVLLPRAKLQLITDCIPWNLFTKTTAKMHNSVWQILSNSQQPPLAAATFLLQHRRMSICKRTDC